MTRSIASPCPFISDTPPRFAWVKLKKYAELTGDSAAAVYARRLAGHLDDGIQCKVIGKSLWVNPPAVENWVVLLGPGVQPV